MTIRYERQTKRIADSSAEQTESSKRAMIESQRTLVGAYLVVTQTQPSVVLIENLGPGPATRIALDLTVDGERVGEPQLVGGGFAEIPGQGQSTFHLGQNTREVRLDPREGYAYTNRHNLPDLVEAQVRVRYSDRIKEDLEGHSSPFLIQKETGGS